MPAPLMRARRTAAALALLTILLGGCSGSDPPTALDPSSAQPPATATPPGDTGVDATPPVAVDLDGDMLIAPPPPSLAVGSGHGALDFRWSLPTPHTRSIRLLEHDARSGTERLLVDVPTGSPEAPPQAFYLPVHPHRVPWADLAWRVEMCALDTCVSSYRRNASGLATNTFQTLHPPVQAPGERVGETLTLSANGALLAVGLPVAGQVALWFTRGASAQRGEALDVSPAAADGEALARAHSSSRELALALSASGDTLAVLSRDTAAGVAPSIGVFERLGEGWFESARFTPFETADDDRDNTRMHLSLSSDGERLLALRLGGHAARLSLSVSLHERGTQGDWHRVVLPPTDADATARWLDVVVTPDLGRIILAGTHAGTQTSTHGETPFLILRTAARGWRAGDALPLAGFDTDTPLALASDARGERIAVGGFEAFDDRSATPVLRRYRLTTNTDTGASADALAEAHAIVLGPAVHRPSEPRLTADDTLDSASFTWRTHAGSALVSVIDDTSGVWRTTLRLPNANGPLDGRVFGTALTSDARADTLVLNVRRDAASDEPGHALLLRAAAGVDGEQAP